MASIKDQSVLDENVGVECRPRSFSDRAVFEGGSLDQFFASANAVAQENTRNVEKGKLQSGENFRDRT